MKGEMSNHQTVVLRENLREQRLSSSVNAIAGGLRGHCNL
jgi:hypothetical protein